MSQHTQAQKKSEMPPERSIQEQGKPEPTASNEWERFFDRLRMATPATIVNEGGRINFGLRAIADGFAIKSGLRPAILNDESLHAPYFREKPNKLPKGLTKFEKGIHLGYASPARAIGGGMTLGALCLGAIYGDAPTTEEEKQKYKDMPVGDYVKMRFRDSLNPKEHATATVGMMTIGNGVMATIAGFKQFSGFKYKGSYSFTGIFKSLPFESVKGALTILAGGSLQFIPNKEYAWQISESVFLWRTPASAAQAWRAWDSGIPGKVDSREWEQGARFMMNKFANAFGVIYGGVRKENGQIIRVSSGDIAPPDIVTTANTPDSCIDCANASNITVQPEESRTVG